MNLKLYELVKKREEIYKSLLHTYAEIMGSIWASHLSSLCPDLADLDLEKVQADMFINSIEDFAIYVSTADRLISEYETNMFNYYFDLIFDTDDLVSIYNERIDYYSNIDHHLEMLKLAVDHDNDNYLAGEEIEVPLCINLFYFYKQTAIRFYYASEDNSTQTIARIWNCLEEMRDCINNNLIIPQSSELSAFFTAEEKEEIESTADYIKLIINESLYSEPSTFVQSSFDDSKSFGTTNNKKTHNTGASLSSTADNKASDATDSKENKIENLLLELDSLIGLYAVKHNVHSLINLQSINIARKKQGLKTIPTSNHLVFSGNPGTGKTTVARLLAELYNAMGILSKGHLVEVDRSGLVAGYVGQTALKTQEIIKNSLGGILFIDEAYTLARSDNGNDYGQEAIDTILKAMEDNRDDFIVIVAGYPQLMIQFIDSNPGLRSRFNKYIQFEDYSAEELIDIFKLMCKKSDIECTDEAIKYVEQLFKDLVTKKEENFANAREARNLLETAITNQANRLCLLSNPSAEDLKTLTIDDFLQK